MKKKYLAFTLAYCDRLANVILNVAKRSEGSPPQLRRDSSLAYRLTQNDTITTSFEQDWPLGGNWVRFRLKPVRRTGFATTWTLSCLACLIVCGYSGYAQSQTASNNDYAAQRATYQYPAAYPPGTASFNSQPVIGFQSQNSFATQPRTAPQRVAQLPAVQQPAIVSPGQTYFPVTQQFNQVPGPNPVFANPGNVLDVDVFVPQNPTGRLSVGATYGSDNGLVGQFILDEKDFDIHNCPRNFQEAIGPRAWKGGGQHFRTEIVPGDELERYLISWSNPYFRNSDYSLGLSAYYFNRQYFDWDEERLGGRISVGRVLSSNLSINTGLRMESVTIANPRVGTSTQLNADLGKSNLYLGSVGLVYDSRVHPYLTAVGNYLGLTFTQAFGDYNYSRGEIDFRNHQQIYCRPDGSGSHTIGYRTKLGFTGSDTPVFENFFAGGITTMRGFEFRGVSPIDMGVRVGGEFQWLNTLEYMFPVTADDMLHGVMFVDFGTVEESIKLNSDNFRVAPGVGLRVHLPFAGMGAPLAFDFAFPVAEAAGDQKKTFNFFIGWMR
jgi:outer membrane protein insertion porin family